MGIKTRSCPHPHGNLVRTDGSHPSLPLMNPPSGWVVIVALCLAKHAVQSGLTHFLAPIARRICFYLCKGLRQSTPVNFWDVENRQDSHRFYGMWLALNPHLECVPSLLRKRHSHDKESIWCNASQSPVEIIDGPRSGDGGERPANACRPS